MYTLSNGTEIRTSLKEMTIGEFEKVTEVMNDESKLSIEKYLDVLEVLGVPEKVINDLTDEELFAIIKDFGNYEYSDFLVPTFSHEGYLYQSYTDEFVLKAKDMALIEKSFKSTKNVFSTIIAILFKRTDLTNKEHYTDAHIKLKRNIALELNAADFYPYVVYLTQKLNSKLKNKVEADEQVTE